jgi:GNAT superfamily N-acetyltransferase
MRELFKDFVIDQELFAAVLDEAQELDSRHYEETETKYRGQPLAPKYPAMLDAEKRGQVAYFTARYQPTGKIVGHVFYYCADSLHAAAYNANEDRYYIDKEHRGSGLARRLLQYAQKCLKERGVTDVFMSSKSPIGGPHIDLFLETEGYKHVANVFHKEL